MSAERTRRRVPTPCTRIKGRVYRRLAEYRIVAGPWSGGGPDYRSVLHRSPIISDIPGGWGGWILSWTLTDVSRIGASANAPRPASIFRASTNPRSNQAVPPGKLCGRSGSTRGTREIIFSISYPCWTGLARTVPTNSLPYPPQLQNRSIPERPQRYLSASRSIMLSESRSRPPAK